MSKVLVIGDEKALAKAIEKHGAINVWWAEDYGPSTRRIGASVGLDRYSYAGSEADQEAFDIVIGGEKKEAPKKSSKPAQKKEPVKKDDGKES
tara:strand:+ start:2225 stop:2503 length:279 start_codon:yes stop_codon:yes gene_type:complete